MSVKKDLVVTKFGGTSLSSAEQLHKVKSIITADPRRKVVVASAPGKRHPGDTKITDKLIDCFHYKEQSRTQPDADECFNRTFREIESRYTSIAWGLDQALGFDLSQELTDVKAQISDGCTLDHAMSQGEYLMAKIMAPFLGFELVNAKDLIFFDSRGEIDEARTAYAFNRLSDLLSSGAVKGFAISGFYGSMPNGSIKVFSRGGSDISGAIVAYFFGAILYENWTDVPGVAFVNPRILKEARVIKFLSFRELRDMSWGGATVIHPDAVKPARIAGIPINIRDTNNPELEGTWILPDTDQRISERSPGIIGMAVKTGFLEINLNMDGMNETVGFLQTVLGFLAYSNISVEHVPTGVDDASIIVEATQVGHKIEEIIQKIKKAYPECEVKIEEGIAILTVVGKNMKDTPGILGEIVVRLGAANVSIKTVNQGASETTISFGIRERDVAAAVRVICNHF